MPPFAADAVRAGPQSGRTPGNASETRCESPCRPVLRCTDPAQPRVYSSSLRKVVNPNFSSIKYLRPLALQTQLGYARIQGPANSDVFGNVELEYSLRYLDHFVEPVDLGHRLIEFVPFVQFNYAQSFLASHLTTKPDLRLTPGLAYQNDYCQVSVGARVALNGAAASGDRVAGLGAVDLLRQHISGSGLEAVLKLSIEGHHGSKNAP